MAKRGKNTGYSTSISEVGIIDRYLHFIEAVQVLKPATRVRIQDYLSDKGDIISESTFHRIRNNLQNGLGIIFDYNRDRGYKIKEESTEELDRFLRLSAIALKGEQIKRAILNKAAVFDYVLFEDSGIVSGIENLSPLIGAILNKQKVSISYQRFGNEKAKVFKKIEPHYIKEYQGRWYLFSYVSWGENKMMTLAIDSRVKAVKVESEFFIRKEEKYFEKIKQVVGLNYSEAEDHFGIEKPAAVRFVVYPEQQAYIEGLPIHPTQKMIEEQKGGARLYEINVLPNYELAQSFLRLGAKVKVISPEPFVDFMRAIIAEMGGLYNLSSQKH